MSDQINQVDYKTKQDNFSTIFPRTSFLAFIRRRLIIGTENQYMLILHFQTYLILASNPKLPSNSDDSYSQIIPMNIYI